MFQGMGNCFHVAVHVGFLEGTQLLLDRLREGLLQNFYLDEKNTSLEFQNFANQPKQNGIAALSIAVLNQDIDMVNLLIKNGVDVNFFDPVQQISPIFLAFKINNEQILEAILAQNNGTINLTKTGDKTQMISELTPIYRLGSYLKVYVVLEPLFFSIYNNDQKHIRLLCKQQMKLGQMEAAVLTQQEEVDAIFYTLARMQDRLENTEQHLGFFDQNQQELEAIVQQLENIAIFFIELDQEVKDPKKVIREAYSREIRPGMTILWKCLELNQIRLAQKLLEPTANGQGPLVNINYQMKETGETVLLKVLKEAQNPNASAAFKNEDTLSMMITMLMDDGNPDLYLKDKTGKSVIDYADGLSGSLRDLFFNKQDKVEKKRKRYEESFKLDPLHLGDDKAAKS